VIGANVHQIVMVENKREIELVQILNPLMGEKNVKEN
jgi:hypothetical protein